VRFTLLLASSALAASLVLSACSSGSGSSTIPGGGSSVAPMGHHGISLHAIAMKADKAKNPCPSSKYDACFGLNYGSGPYVEWSACYSTYDCPPTYDIVATADLTTPKDKAVKPKVMTQDWSPSPGNPTYQYITAGSKYKNGSKVRYVDATSACLYYYPSDCGAATFGIY
jgi:hypothetical protein